MILARVARMRARTFRASLEGTQTVPFLLVQNNPAVSEFVSDNLDFIDKLSDKMAQDLQSGFVV